MMAPKCLLSWAAFTGISACHKPFAWFLTAASHRTLWSHNLTLDRCRTILYQICPSSICFLTAEYISISGQHLSESSFLICILARACKASSNSADMRSRHSFMSRSSWTLSQWPTLLLSQIYSSTSRKCPNETACSTSLKLSSHINAPNECPPAFSLLAYCNCKRYSCVSTYPILNEFLGWDISLQQTCASIPGGKVVSWRTWTVLVKCLRFLSTNRMA